MNPRPTRLAASKALRCLIACLAPMAAGTVWGQSEIAGPNTFPQFRDMSGLPGGAFGINPDGSPGIHGAMAISTPVGYSLANLRFDIGLGNRSVDNRFRFINFNKNTSDRKSDGTGQVMFGLKTPVGNLTSSMMILSSELDTVFNFQLQVPIRCEKLGFSLGVQNLHNRPEADIEKTITGHALSRSIYAVATYQVADGAYVSLGKGDVRFKGVFGNGSFNVAPRLKLTGEYDAFGWNYGVAYDLGTIGGLGKMLDRNHTTLLLGSIQGKRAFGAVNFTF